MRLAVALVASVIVVFPASGNVITVQATTGPGQTVTASQSLTLQVLDTASVELTLKFTGLGCSPFPSCNQGFNVEADLLSPFPFSSIIIQISGSGGLVDPFEICGGRSINGPIPCDTTLAPGAYTLGTSLFSSSSGTPVPAGSVTASLNVISGGPVVITPEPTTVAFTMIGMVIVACAGAFGPRPRHAQEGFTESLPADAHRSSSGT
jgi:hypothetical protein